MSAYAFGKVVNMGYEQAIEAITAALAKQGFGVLTEIDVAATLKKKLDIDRAPYRILGACNPQFAAKAIEMEPQIGALLPCNVIVRVDEAGRTVVEMMDPNAVLTLVDKPGIAAIATEVRTRLEAALAAV
ncbi:MAG: DUF302 domain-containing protein [Burkholderiales bacterium]